MNEPPIPNNLATLLGQSEEGDKAISKVLAGQSIDDNLLTLGRVWNVRVQFASPTEVYLNRRRRKTSDVHVFHGFFKHNGALCYTFKRWGRRGLYLPSVPIISYEPRPDTNDVFNDFEQFKKKFDPLFITETEIQNLWNKKSGQHGNQYRPSDFRRLGRQGREVLKRFMRHFKGVSPTNPDDLPHKNPGYLEYSHAPGERILREYYDSPSPHHFSRDIKISHQSNIPYVWYSSEYHRCGNGRYGLMANKSEYLWLEDD